MQRDLVERARKGDHDAFAELAGAAISRLDAAAWLILRDPEQAKDAVQNTLVRAWRDLPTLRDPDLFDAWVHRMLVNACIDEARRLRRHRVDVELTNLHAPAIAGIESRTHPRALAHTDRPDPQTPLEAKFSVQYCVARAALDGKVVLGHFEGDAHRDPAVRDLVKRVRATPYTGPLYA